MNYLKRNNLIHNSIKTIKCLGINLTKKAKDQILKPKPLFTDINENTTYTSIHRLKETMWFKMSLQSNAIYKFKAI